MQAVFVWSRAQEIWTYKKGENLIKETSAWKESSDPDCKDEQM